MTDGTTELAVLFADVCGSTRLYDTLGDEEARSRIGCVLSRLAEVTVRNDGTVVKSIGDELLCTFPDGDHAVEAAVSMELCVSTRRCSKMTNRQNWRSAEELLHRSQPVCPCTRADRCRAAWDP